jgi:signal transduction histidine kinase/DNA-binding response OmpR family regulator
VTVRSGSEALQAVLRREFAVILLDVNMPDIDGFETASLIRKYKKSAHTPIIFITAYADEMQTSQGYSLGAVDYILSPILPDVLRSKVKVFVELYQMQQRTRQMAEERVELAHAEEASRRSNFLALASRELGESLNLAEGMRRLVGLVVPRFAERATLLVDDEAQGRWLWASEAGGGTWQYDAVPAEVAEALPHGVPLLVGERRLGLLLVESTDSSLLEELASRASMALENARLYERLQEASRRKDEFLAMLSHELRNPLAPIRTAMEVIRRVAPPDPTLALAREAVDRQVSHLVRLVEELLDVSRISEGRIALKKEQVELAKVIGHSLDTVRPLIEARNQRLVLSLPARPVWLFGDFVRLAQVVSNLVNNSAKYTPEGGRIEVTAEARDGEAQIVVRDDGEGIDAQLLPRVFELFVQGERSLDRSQGGLGLGLTLVKRLVELHDGRVQALSDGPGRGAEFRVTLPCISVVQKDTGQKKPATHASPVQGRRVLVVDDNLDAAETIAAFLRLEGHQTKVVSEGPLVLSTALVFEPQVVVLDIGLPGLDGYAIARQLRAHDATSQALLIALTGYGRDEDRARAAEAGFDCHFTKPANPLDVQAAIGRGRGANGATLAAAGSAPGDRRAS